MTNAPQGFLGIDLDDLIKPITDALPGPVGDAIRNVVSDLVSDTPGSPKIGDPQPAGTPPIPVTAGSAELSSAVKAIDTVLKGLDLVLSMGFLIPDQYEAPLRALAGALRTVRGWLD